MKCFFCNKRCRLLKKDEPDYLSNEMTWICSNHPTRVLHHVNVEKRALRRHRGTEGTLRTWTHSSITWVNNKGQAMIAKYLMDADKKPDRFYVYNFIHGKNRWDDKLHEVFSLDYYPKEFSPENIVEKISILTVFS